MNHIPTYTRKPLEVRAVRLPDLRNNKNQEGREQLRAAVTAFGLHTGIRYRGDVFTIQDANMKVIPGPNRAGNWLVCRPSGAVELVAADVFAEDYAPVKAKED